jgi:lipoprotein-releasing system ATP-binding protein
LPQAAAQPASSLPRQDSPILLASGLRKIYRMGDSQLEILRHVDLSIKNGEFIAIEGRSGSGKSTLLHILGALESYEGGSVQFDGTDLSKLTSSQRSQLRNRQFGFVFQFYYLLPELNVLENTLLAAMVEHSWWSFQKHRAELRKKARALLAQLGMEHRLKHRPRQLSGGERQRVAIARALMNEPRVLFADEPTGNLDFETGRQIMSLLEKLHRDSGQTIIMVTHDRGIAREADRILVLKNGVLESAQS